jgi:predicted lipid carrier protein YhbT
MADPIADFFAHLEEQGPQPLLAKAHGTVRWDVEGDNDTQTWFVRVNKSEVEVLREWDGDVSARARGSKALFEALCSGEANAMSAMLRNEITIEGDVELLLLLQRVFPGPSQSSHPRAVAGANS